MSNYKTINWNEIRLEYVMNPLFPSFDDLSKQFNVSKPLLINKANDRDDLINGGSTWAEQREKYVNRKRQAQEDEAVKRQRKMIGKVIDELNSIGLKAFKLVSRELDQLIELQQQAIDNNEPFSVKSYIKLGDVAKIAESLYKITDNKQAKDMIVKLEVYNKEQKSLEDFSDKELEKIEYKIKHGDNDIIDAEYSEVNDNDIQSK